MHSAPAVSYPVGRSSMRTLLYLLPGLLAGLVCAAWAWQSLLSDVWRLLMPSLCLLVWGLAAWATLHPPRGQLVWDGLSWRWEEGASRTGSVRARLDWQQGLLLEFRPQEGRTVWLWVERAAAPLFWDGLRRAVFAAPVADALAGPEVRV